VTGTHGRAAGACEGWLARTLSESGGIPAQWGVYVKDLATGETAGLRAAVAMDTMSVIKLPLLLHLLTLAATREVNLDRRIRVSTDRKRLGTGVLSTLDDDTEISLRDAGVLMTTVSDNTATDIVFEAVGGPDAVNEAMVAVGLGSIKALGSTFDWFRSLASSMDPAYAGYGPEELFVKGYPVSDLAELLAARARYHLGGGRPFGLATAEQLGRLLEMVSDGEYVSRAVCDDALRVLRLQVATSRIPRYLPQSATVFHKAGDFAPFIANDVAIIRRSDGSGLVLCMLSAGHTGVWGHLEEVCSRVAEKCFFNMGELG
jgi:beta-lactamase class A